MRHDNLLCPVCGLLQDKAPWGIDSSSDEICSCCGIHYGYDDGERLTFEGAADQFPLYSKWRTEWITGGMQWWASWKKPSDYDPVKQLARIGIVVPARGHILVDESELPSNTRLIESSVLLNITPTDSPPARPPGNPRYFE